MNDLLAFGFAAGIALAIPLGPMAIMLINTTISKGWRHGAAGALGMASVDFSYALVVFLLGGLVASFLMQWGIWISLAGAAILLGLGVNIILQNLRLLRSDEASPKAVRSGTTVWATFGIFVGTTILNPPTALFFLAMAATLGEYNVELGAGAAIWFALGVFFGSVIWQEGLALAGLGLRKLADRRVRALIGCLGGTLIIILSATLALKAIGA